MAVKNTVDALSAAVCDYNCVTGEKCGTDLSGGVGSNGYIYKGL
jgi:hypothetical protein